MSPKPDLQHVASPCYRTLDEIAGWIQLSDNAKRALIAALAARRARAGAMMQVPDAADGQR
jgi:predicted Fe-S protein YdhL (DUF1289 family)